MEKKREMLERRLAQFALFTVFVFILIAGQLANLQLVHGDQYTALAQQNRIRIMRVSAPRGIVFDRSGNVLADSRPAYTASINYLDLKNSDEVINRLDDILGMSHAVFGEPLNLHGTQPAPLVYRWIRKGTVVLRDPAGRTYDPAQDFVVNADRGTVARTQGSAIPDGGLVYVDYEYSEIRKKIYEQRGRLFEPVRLKVDISPEIHTYLEENRPDLPGAVVEVQPVRNYPRGALASHVLGYVGEIQDYQLREFESRGYRMGDIVGQAGLESLYTWDAQLRGSDGGRQVEVDFRGRPVGVLHEEAPVPGNNLVLTLDARVQAAAEEKMRQVLQDLQAGKNVKPSPEAKAGAAVAIDVRTGQILAMASIPDFNPNAFAGGISVEEYNRLKEEEAFTNRAIQARYPPGSTFKMITAMVALDQKKVSPTELFSDDGGVYRVGLGNQPMTCWSTGHGILNLNGAIAQSCNIVFYKIAARFRDAEGFAAVASEFGLGRKTGLKDITGEIGGILPTRENKRIWNKDEPEWRLSDTLRAAIGQGLNTYTPLQLANYVAAIANGGKLYRPYLVQRVVAPDGKLVTEFQPELLGEVSSVSKFALDQARQGMRSVVEWGTAAWLFRDFPVKVAAKTGTAEIFGKASHGLFLAYAPYDDPEIAVAVIIEHGTGGSVAGGPVAKAMLEAYFGLTPMEVVQQVPEVQVEESARPSILP